MAVPYYDLADLTRRADEAMRLTEVVAADAREQIAWLDKLLDRLKVLRMAKNITARPSQLILDRKSCSPPSPCRRFVIPERGCKARPSPRRHDQACAATVAADWPNSSRRDSSETVAAVFTCFALS